MSDSTGYNPYIRINIHGYTPYCGTWKQWQRTGKGRLQVLIYLQRYIEDDATIKDEHFKTDNQDS
jgi:hypothetical protein